MGDANNYYRHHLINLMYCTMREYDRFTRILFKVIRDGKKDFPYDEYYHLLYTIAVVSLSEGFFEIKNHNENGIFLTTEVAFKRVSIIDSEWDSFSDCVARLTTILAEHGYISSAT